MTNTLKVRTYPDRALRKKTRRVENFNEHVIEVLKKMSEIMYLSNGVGLAATQVGLDISLLVADTGSGLMKLANPEIVERSGRKTPLLEGCLSLKGVEVMVVRDDEVKVRAQNENGEFFTQPFTGLEAKVLQHEIDHLQGRLIIDHLGPVRCFFAKAKLALNGLKHGKRTKSCEVICHVKGRDI